MPDDTIKLSSGSGITFGEQTLEEWLDEKARAEGNISGKIFKAEIPYVPKRNGKINISLKYDTKPTAERIFTKREIYSEYMEKFLMELVNAEAPLSKLVLQSLLDGKRKTPKDLVSELSKLKTSYSVNFGSVSSVMSKIVRSNLGPFVMEFWENSRLESLQINELAGTLGIEDAYSLYQNEMEIEEATSQYPGLYEIVNGEAPKIEGKKLRVTKKEKILKEKPRRSISKISMAQGILKVLLFDCGKHTTRSISEKIKEYYGGDNAASKIAVLIKDIRNSEIGKLLKVGKENKSFTYQFIFDVNDGMDEETLENLRTKKSKITVESLKESHPKVYQKYLKYIEDYDEPEVSINSKTIPEIEEELLNESEDLISEARTGKGPFKGITSRIGEATATQDPRTLKEIVEETLRDSLQKLVLETIHKTLSNKTTEPLSSGGVEVKVSGGIDINFSFKRE